MVNFDGCPQKIAVSCFPMHLLKIIQSYYPTAKEGRWRWAVVFVQPVLMAVSDDLNLVLMTDAKYTDEKFLETSNSPLSLEGSYTLVGGRIALVSEQQGWELSLWGKTWLTPSIALM